MQSYGALGPNEVEIETDIPSRLDSLPFSLWHWKIVAVLGISWILDGFEVTVIGVIGGVLEEPDTLSSDLNSFSVGSLVAAYLLGACLGSLLFGVLADWYGRKKIFVRTPVVYIIGALLSAFAPNFVVFLVARVVVGLGIGGEYAAVNSAIQEFIPKEHRGKVTIAINGSYWLGAALVAAISFRLLDTKYYGIDQGWRVLFYVGAGLGVVAFVTRAAFLEESPRWLVSSEHREAEADAIVRKAEAQYSRVSGGEIQDEERPVSPKSRIVAGDLLSRLYKRKNLKTCDIWRILWHYKKRCWVSCVLMVAQVCFLSASHRYMFFYNAVYLTYDLALDKFFGIRALDVAYHVLILCAGNFLGAILLGWLFDLQKLGRRIMIFVTYALSALLVFLYGLLFVNEMVGVMGQTLVLSCVFFFSSPAASSGYLTVSEIFPLEIRASAIAIFYFIGTLLGGIVGPLVFGFLIDDSTVENQWDLFWAYLVAAILMLMAAFAELRWGIDAERKSLESLEVPWQTRTIGTRKVREKSRDHVDALVAPNKPHHFDTGSWKKGSKGLSKEEKERLSEDNARDYPVRDFESLEKDVKI